MSEELLCGSCEQPKSKLYPYKSKLVGAQLFMCKSCLASKYEPRWTIIMAARTYGATSVQKYIKGHLYVGEPIKASEIIK